MLDKRQYIHKNPVDREYSASNYEEVDFATLWLRTFASMFMLVFTEEFGATDMV